MILTAALVIAAATRDVPIFTRNEPHLEDANDAIAAGDPDVAIEDAHAAVASDDDERAIIEYDIGAALIARARKDQQTEKEQQAPTKDPSPPPQAPSPPKFDDAIQSFERAAALARDKRIVSEAHLAVGNAALEMSKLDDAIAGYRRAMIADPQNVRARRNLQRALEMKQAQPPPPPDSGGGENDDKKKNDDDKKDGDKGDQKKDGDQGQQSDPKNDEKKDGEQKDQKQDEQKQGDQPKPDPKDGAGDEKKDQPQPKDGDDQKQDGQQAAPAKKKPTSKEDAKRILQGVRSRERPLTPLEMRGSDKQKPKEGKDW